MTTAAATSTLLILGHPGLAASRINRRLLDGWDLGAHVTVHDLYQAYPQLAIDAATEQARLVAHDEIVLQFPLHWYSVPGFVKLWIDTVFDRGWAYGTGRRVLGDKGFGVVVTVGSPEAAYAPEGINRFCMAELLRPLEATAHRVSMRWHEPHIVFNCKLLEEDALDLEARRYRRRLTLGG